MSLATPEGRWPLLARQVRRLATLRWVAAALILVGGLVPVPAWNSPSHAAPMIAIAVVLAIANVLAVRSFAGAEPGVVNRRRLLTTATVMLYLDLSAMALLVGFTGGVASPILGFMVLHMVFATLVLPRRRAQLAAIAAVIGLVGGQWLFSGWPRAADQLAAIACWSVLIVLTAELGNRLAHAMYARELALVRQNRRVVAATSRLHAQQAAMLQHEKMVSMGQIASGIVHEITNPVANIDMLLQVMQRRPDTPRPESVSAMREQIRRIQDIVRQLNSFSHPGEGGFQILPVNDVVEQAISMLMFDRRLKVTTLVRELSDDAGQARLNPHAMQQILTNILRNALDATEGSPTPRVAVRTRADADRCVIEIEDNGCGIPAEHLPKLYEPFFTTKSVGKGTGLGLSISNKLVREHGGTLAVTSEPARGTCFSISIPCERTDFRSSGSRDARGTGPAASP